MVLFTDVFRAGHLKTEPIDTAQGLAYGTFAGLCAVQGFHVETGIRVTSTSTPTSRSRTGGPCAKRGVRKSARRRPHAGRKESRDQMMVGL